MIHRCLLSPKTSVNINSIRSLVLLTTLVLAGVAQATGATWVGPAGTQDWSLGTNWSTNPTPPGSTSGTTSADVATFNTALGSTLITIDANRNIGSLSFASGAGGFTFGSAGVSAGEALLLSSGGSVSVASGVTSSVIFNAPLVLEPLTASGVGTYSFTNNFTPGTTTAATPKIVIAGSLSGGTTSSTVTLTLAGNVGTRNAGNSAQAIDQANNISGVISDGGATGGLGVTINGANLTSTSINAWNLTGLNTYSGPTTITNGVLYFNTIGNVGQASSLGTGTQGSISVSSYLIYTGAAASTDRTITSSNGQIYNNGTGVLTLNGNLTIANGAGVTVRGTNNTIINGLITGTGSSLSRTNGSVLTLTNANNSFTGVLTISAGTISTNSIANAGTNSSIGAGTTINFGQNQTADNVGTLQFTGASGGSSNRAMVINGGSSNTAAAPATAVIENTVAGQMLVMSGTMRASGSNPVYFSALKLAGAGDGVMSGVIGGLTGATTTPIDLTLTKIGTGTWTLTNANLYYGLTNVQAGVLNIQNSAALGGTAGGNTTTGTTAGGTIVSSGATLQLQNNISVGAEDLSLAGTGAAGQTGALVNVSGTNSYAGALTLTANTTVASDSGRLNLTNTAAIVGSGGSRTLTLAGAGDGSLASDMDTGVSSLTKTGAGLWTLSGNNTYTGTTTVSGGTLNVTGSLGNTAVSVASGATFAYAGTLSSTLTVAGGASLIIGDAETAGSTGTLTIGGTLTLNNTSVLNFDLGTTGDLIQANGALVLDGILHVTPGVGFTSNTYKLIDYTGALTNNGLIVQNLAGYDLAVVVDTVNQDVNLTVNVVSGQYWDGSNTIANNVVDGGSGVWTNASTQWTTADGSTNGDWGSAVEKIAIFAGTTGGTVQVQDNVTVNGLQFGKNYTLTDAGGSLQVANAATEVRVDAGVTADVSASITGAGGINKTGDGTLTLSATAGQNTYAGTTQITSGTLKVGANNSLPTGTTVIVGSGSQTGTLDLSSADQQVASLQLVSNTAIATDVVTIGAGHTLTVTGTGSLTVGAPSTAKAQTFATFNGGGSLVINNASGNLELGLQTATVVVPGGDSPFDATSNTNKATIDFSGLSSLSATVNEFRVGYGLNINTTATLSDTSNTINAKTLQVGNSNSFNAGTGSTTLILGAGTSVIQTNTLNIGVSKAVSTLKFASQTAGSPGTLVLGGRDTATVNMVVGSTVGTATGASPTGVLDLRGHNASITANSVIIGKRDAGGSGGASGTIYFDGGTFTVNTLDIGTMTGNAGDSTHNPSGSGTLNINGGTFTVNSGGSFKLATYGNTNGFSSASGTVNITGGSLISNVNIIEGGGANATTTNTVSTINLNGGTLDMTGHNIGDATNTINTITLASGTLKDVGEINGGGAVSKTTTGVLTLLGTNTFTGDTTIAAGTLQVGNGGASGTLGSGNVIDNATLAFNRSDLLEVGNPISGTGVVNQNGTGTTVLKGANTYSGVTTVAAGTLVADNNYAGTDSATGTNTVNVNSTATLGGQGRIGGSVALASGSTLAPGGNATSIAANSGNVNTDTGTLMVVGNLTANAGSTIALELKTQGTHGLTPTYSGSDMLLSVTGTSTDGGNDRLIVNGTLTFDSASNTVVTFASGYAPAYHDVFDLIDWTGVISPGYYDDGDGVRLGGAADNALYALDLPDLTSYNSGWFWDVSQFGTTGIVAIVPEPGRGMLLLTALIGMLMRRRRR